MRDVNGKIIYYLNITMSEEPKWRERKPKNKEPEPETGEPEPEVEEPIPIEKKIENIRAKKKGFSKLPHLENIYETPPPIVEGLSKTNKNNAAKLGYKKDTEATKSFFKDLFKKIREFTLKNAKYTNIFYDLDLLFKGIENSIVKMYDIEKANSPEWYYKKEFKKQFENGVLNTSDVNITLHAEYEYLPNVSKKTNIDKKRYKDMANANSERYKNEYKNAKSDAKILTSNLRNYANMLINILITYNILYTWIIDDGKKQGIVVEENTKSVPDIIQFAAKPMFVLLYIHELIFKSIGFIATISLDSVKLFTYLFVFISITGFVPLIAKGFSKLMVNSLTTILNGKFSKSAFVYLTIILIWLSNLAMTIVKNPSLIAGLVPLGVMIFTYIVIIVLHCLFLGPSIGLAISFYIVYRFLLLIPIIFGSKTLDGFKMVDDKIKEGIKVETEWKVRIYNHLFSIVFTLITLFSMFDFGINLKNLQLRTGLPMLLSAILVIFLKLKYDSAHDVAVSNPNEVYSDVSMDDIDIDIKLPPSMSGALSGLSSMKNML